MKKNAHSPLYIALGTSILSGLSLSSVQANETPVEDNPFTLTELSSGYMNMAEADSDKKGSMKMKDGACGEGKCGSSMMKSNEDKMVEGKCAGNKPVPAPKKPMEGKCGEGKCGSSMKM